MTGGQNMTKSEQVRTKIAEIARGKPIVLSAMRGYASSENIRQILSRMVEAGELERVARGVYVRPKKSPYTKSTPPSAKEIAEALTQNTGEIISIHGAEAARQLHLSTQVPTQPIFYTTGNTRRINVGKMTITLKHISPRKIVSPGTTTGTIISALWYLGKKNVSMLIIKKIITQLTDEQFNALMNKVESMPYWMADLFYQNMQDEKND